MPDCVGQLKIDFTPAYRKGQKTSKKGLTNDSK